MVAMLRTLVLCVLWAAVLPVSQAWAACSSYKGLATINEIYRRNNGTHFIEVKLLALSLTSADYNSWTIRACRRTNVCSSSLPLSGATRTDAWLVLDNVGANNIDLDIGMDVILRDGSGNTIDYVSMEGYTQQRDGSCSLPYDSEHSDTINNTDNIYRLPDGTGDWTSTPGNSSQETKQRDNTQNLPPGAPLVSLNNIAAVQGDALEFTFTLSATYGQPISISYQTQNDTARAGIDYVATSGTLTIPAGATTATISVPTIDTPTVGSLRMFMQITQAVNASVSGAIGIGTILDDSFIADWRMDEAAWNGTANEVRDSSGNGFHGTAAIANGSTPRPTAVTGAPAYTSGSQSTCNYGQFDATTGTIRTFGYVSISGAPTLNNSFTFTAWVRTTQPGQSGQRILVRDDAQNGWGFSLGDPGNGRIRLFNRRISSTGSVTGDGSNSACGSVFCLDTAAVITANNWFFVAVAVDTVARRVTHFVYNQAGTLLSSTSSAYTGTWLDGSGTLAIGGETIDSDEGRQASFHFKGNIDEVRIVSGALSQLGVEAMLRRVRPCAGAGISHFELNYAAPALTCAPQDVTIRACANASCTTEFTGAVNATLAPSGWVGGNVKSFSGGSASFRYQRTTVGSDNLGVSSSTPATSAPVLCRINGGAASTNCALNFVDSGLVFDIPNLIANRPSGTVKLRAVRKDNTSVACVPAFANVTRNVSFFSSYLNPGPLGRPVSRSVTLNGAAIGQNSGSATALALAFDGNGEANLNAVYTDAGQMQVNATYTGSAATNDAGLLMEGSDQFVSRPAGFCVTTAANCAAGDITCPVFARAGRNFNVSIKAVGWESDTDTDLCSGPNGETPNYAQSAIPLSLSLVSPGSGAVGTLSTPQYNHTASVSATNTVSTAISEVGVFRLTASPPAYLGESIPAATSANIGRMIPDYFSLAQVRTGFFSPGCVAGGTPFAWIGQALTWSVTPQTHITAHAFGGAVTRNYTIAPYQRLGVGGVNTAVPLSDNVALGTNASLLPVSVVPQPGSLAVESPGVLSYTWSHLDTLRYIKSPSAAVAPFTPSLTWQMNAVTDADGVLASGVPLSFNPSMTFEMRYGRLRLENAFGPEITPLVVPLQTQYFNGTSYVLNAADSCWTYNTSAEAAVSGSLTSIVPNSPLAATLSGGMPPAGKALTLAAPGSGNTGTVNLTYNVPDYLKFDWNQDGVDDDNPTATATFGLYRGHDRIIFWREVEN